MVAIQAMACGTPVVAATSGAERDAVIDSTTGLLMPSRQPAQLALRIRRLLANSLQLEAYGMAAADRARSRYSWERIGRETLTAYGCVRRRPPRCGTQSPFAMRGGYLPEPPRSAISGSAGAPGPAS
jgi:glycosyltransferase involved in cell wall biosynthesis